MAIITISFKSSGRGIKLEKLQIKSLKTRREEIFWHVNSGINKCFKN